MSDDCRISYNKLQSQGGITGTRNYTQKSVKLLCVRLDVASEDDTRSWLECLPHGYTYIRIHDDACN